MDFTYGGLFPFLNIGAEYRIDRNGYYKGQKIYWNELLPYAGHFCSTEPQQGKMANQPGRRNQLYISPANIFPGPYKDSIKNTSYSSLDPQLLFTHQLQAGRMQIYPSFAQITLD